MTAQKKPRLISKPAPDHPLTPARISLGRTGTSIPTTSHLQFQLDHAQARDAVHTPLDVPSLLESLRTRNLNPIALRSSVPANSTGTQRQTYLRRPDLGRRLHPESLATLQALSQPPADIAIILADGLSAQAIERHAIPLLDAIIPNLTQTHTVTVVTQARVAIGDEIAAALNSKLALVLIGERPGLTAPDSLGVYLTWNPRPGLTTNAERNCISNIRLEGLSYADAAHRILTQLKEATRLQHTGVVQSLKLEPGSSSLPSVPSQNFVP